MRSFRNCGKNNTERNLRGNQKTPTEKTLHMDIHNTCSRPEDKQNFNEELARLLDGLHSVDMYSLRECADGKKRHLCEVPSYGFISSLGRPGKRFVLYRVQGDGKPSPINFPIKKKRTVQELIKKGIVIFASDSTSF